MAANLAFRRRRVWRPILESAPRVQLHVTDVEDSLIESDPCERAFAALEPSFPVAEHPHRPLLDLPRLFQLVRTCQSRDFAPQLDNPGEFGRGQGHLLDKVVKR